MSAIRGCLRICGGAGWYCRGKVAETPDHATCLESRANGSPSRSRRLNSRFSTRSTPRGVPPGRSSGKRQLSRLYSWQASLLGIRAKDGNANMKRRYTTLLLTLVCLPAVPVLAQTTIGGGSCTSGTLNGTYEFLLNGRQVAATGAVSKVFQGVGTPAFDGLSKVTLTMTANTVGATQAFGTPDR